MFIRLQVTIHPAKCFMHQVNLLVLLAGIRQVVVQ